MSKSKRSQVTRPSPRKVGKALPPPVTVHFYCDGCDGNGDIHGEECSVCHGTGHQPIREVLPRKAGARRAR